MPPLPRRFYARPTPIVAEKLLGKILHHSGCQAMIVETEAYLHQVDPASHSYRGPTHRTRAMFGPPGHAYIYRLHGHICLNVVCEAAGVGAAVLIRAVEPLFGITLPTHGPGRLTKALNIDMSLYGADFTNPESPLTIHPPIRTTELEIGISSRIGISKALDLPLRFFITGNPYLSRKTGNP